MNPFFSQFVATELEYFSIARGTYIIEENTTTGWRGLEFDDNGLMRRARILYALPLPYCCEVPSHFLLALVVWCGIERYYERMRATNELI